MNYRERCLKTLLFENTDKVPLLPGYGRESTRARWHSEGLPEKYNDSQTINQYAYQLAGGIQKLSEAEDMFTVNERMIPQF